MDGTPFGRYRLVELLGRGGMGEVWRAYDTGTDRVVAVKVLPPHFAQDPTFAERFRREARAAAQLNNAHVVPIHDYGDIDGRLYVDMRLINGHDLQAELRSGPMHPARAVEIVGQVAKALNAAHRAGLIHRDVKPSNILLDEDDMAYLIDFGIARAATDPGLTGTGATVGTWAYMAPERFSTNQIDARSDVYSLTCVLHECLTGAHPFPGDSFEQMIAGHMMKAPPRPSEQNSYLATFDDVIAAGLAKNPDHRFSTTKDLAAAAHSALTATTAQTIPTRMPDSRRAPTVPIPPPPPPQFPGCGWPPADPTQYRYAPPPPEPPRPPSSQSVWWRRKVALIPIAMTITVAVVAAAVLIASRDSANTNTNTPTTTTSSGQSSKTTVYGPQQPLPFVGLTHASQIAASGSGTVYVSDWAENRVTALAAGSAAQTILPFEGLSRPAAVTVDPAGTVYVADYGNNRVVSLTAGAATQTVLPFSGLKYPNGIAVDDAGTVYVSDLDNNRVVALAAGATAQTVLPFNGIKRPDGVAVDDKGTVYAADSDNHRVLALAAGASSQTVVPFTGLNTLSGVAADKAGKVYVADFDNSRIVSLAGAPTAQATLPFTGIHYPIGVAVDDAGNVYTATPGTEKEPVQVLKLPAV